LVKEYFAEASIANRHLNQAQGHKLFKSSENQSINLIVFASNAFPLVLSPTWIQTSQTARKSEANERTRQHPNP
jgi:hypothetical protein